MNKIWFWVPIVAGFFALLPFVAGDFYVNLGSQMMIATIFALSLNLLVGYGGLTSLGHAAFLGVAAYLSAWFTTRAGFGHGTAALLSIIGTTMCAALFGLIALRASGLGFLMITLALSQVLWGLAYRWVSVTNGDNGMAGLTRPMPFGISIESAASFYWFALIVVILGGVGSLVGAFLGSFIIGFTYTFGSALFPDLAYVILFLPMIIIIAFRPQGLFGRRVA